MQPRVPVRAATSGVTSVHVGVRPRLHPSLSETSIQRNQPDYSVTPPMFSPEGGNQTLPRDAELYQKAQKEYEDWLDKKKEREGSMDMDNNGYGTRDWAPRDRVIARPSVLQNHPENQQLFSPPVRSIVNQPQAPHLASVAAAPILIPPVSIAPAPSSAGSEESMHAATPQEQYTQQWPNDPYQMYQGWYNDPNMYQQYPHWDPNQYWGHMQAQGMSEEEW